jgi:nicotinamide riboside kinase
MKIAVMGSHGTGKTTLLLEMASYIRRTMPGLDVRLMDECARECPLPINEKATERSQRWIFARQIIREIELDAGSAGRHVLLCDRTVLDSFAYSELRGFSPWVVSSLPLALEWFREPRFRYHRVYFLRPGFAPAADGVRSTDPEYQAAIDRILCRWISEYKLRVIEATPAQALLDFCDWFEMAAEDNSVEMDGR